MTAVKQTIMAIWASHSLARYAPIYGVIQVSLFLIGVFFWWDARTGAQGFNPDTWGALAYTLPAEFWALVNIAASTITFLGLMDPRHRRMVMIGSALHAAQFAALAGSILFSGGEAVVGLYAAIFFLPLHLLVWWQALHDN